MAILELRGITKSFGGIKAGDDVSIEVKENTLLVSELPKLYLDFNPSEKGMTVR